MAAAPKGGSVPSSQTTADGSISLGQKVTWSGKPGTVRYIGAVKFAGGEYIGLELTEATGMHNGSVMGVSYFECAPKHGAFAQQAQLQTGAPAPAAAPAIPAAPAAAPAAPAAAPVSLSVGQQVMWQGKLGIVRYIGSVKFASGEYVGLELTEPAGMHNGTVMGVSYFSCAPKHGAFAQASQLQARAMAAA